MRFRPVVIGTVLALLPFTMQPLLADEKADRAKIFGVWQPEAAEESAWSFSEKGDSIQITETKGDTKLASFACTPGGAPCEVKNGGKKASVTIWYSGPKLVLMETKGSEVTEREFAVSADGARMELQVKQVVPAGKPETVQFKRMQLSASGK